MTFLQRNFGWMVLVSEFGHVFCCVLPTVFTVLSLAANIGMIGAAPAALLGLHEAMHHYEVPIIIFSGVMLLLGWGAYWRVCQDDSANCAHPHDDAGSCHPHGQGGGGCVHRSGKSGDVLRRNTRILVVATALFLINLSIYAFIHKNILGLDVFRVQGISATDQHKD